MKSNFFDACNQIVRVIFVYLSAVIFIGSCSGTPKGGVEQDAQIEDGSSDADLEDGADSSRCETVDDDCDGEDDDCDGTADEDFTPHEVSCGQGVCQSTGMATACEVNEAGVSEEVTDCVPGVATGSDEDCNGVDDDCDGTADDGYGETEESCGQGACQSTGVIKCIDGIVQSTCMSDETKASDEQCNGLDDDCDGEVDETDCGNQVVPTWISGVLTLEETGPYGVSVSFSGASDDEDLLATYRVYVDGALWNEVSFTRTVEGDFIGARIEGLTPTRSYLLKVEAVDANDNESTDGPSLSVTTDALVNVVDSAPALTWKEANDFESQVSFLYEGENAVQQGVQSGFIEEERVSVVQGDVKARADGTALAGVKVSIPSQPEAGFTYTDANGHYYLAVNGGGDVTLRFTRGGYLRVERTVSVEWNSYAFAEEVQMVALDTVSTTIRALSEEVQVAQSSTVEDRWGSRQVTLLFPENLEAKATFVGDDGESGTDDDEEVQLETLTVRATEYTVGEDKALALPGTMPLTIAVNYAVELSVDEALEMGAEHVEFSEPITYLLDNYPDYPVGTILPVGIYEFSRSLWVPDSNGLVVQLLGTDEEGRAELDMDGDGIEESLEAYEAWGLSDSQRIQIASRYDTSGEKTVWMVKFSHFSPCDMNSAPTDPNATGPNKPDNENDDRTDEEGNQCEEEGCILGVNQQTVAEEWPVHGTPFNLRYQSDRHPGFRANRILRFAVQPEETNRPDIYKKTRITVDVAGQHHVLIRQFEEDDGYELENETWYQTFEWDGKDIFDRPMGPTTANIKVCMVYSPPSSVSTTDDIVNVVNLESYFGGQGIDYTVQIDYASYEYSVCSSSRTNVRGLQNNSRDQGLLGLELDVHHRMYPLSTNITAGDGRIAHPNIGTLETVAGGGTSSTLPSTTTFGAFDYRLQLDRIAVSPDGRIFFPTRATAYSNHLWYVEGDSIHRLSVPSTRGSCRIEQQMATTDIKDACLEITGPIRFAPDGTLYWSETHAGERISTMTRKIIRRMKPDGTVEPVAGFGTTYTSSYGGSWRNELNGEILGDGGDAMDARICGINDIRPHSDGSLYFYDYDADRIRRIDAAGHIETVVGRCGDDESDLCEKTCVDGGSIRCDDFDLLLGGSDGSSRATFDVAQDGRLLLSTDIGLVEVGPERTLTVLADLVYTTYFQDGDALSKGGFIETALYLDNERIVIYDGFAEALFEVSPDKRVHRIGRMGNSTYDYDPSLDLLREDHYDSFDNPLLVPLCIGGSCEENIEVGPNETIYIADGYGIHSLRTDIRADKESFRWVDSSSGMIHYFDENGLHTSSKDALTGRTLLTFEHDEATGYLTSMTMPEGTLTVTRISDATVTMTSPDGQVTRLIDVDGDGYADELSYDNDPYESAVAFTYSSNENQEGLLTEYIGFDSIEHQMVYDEDTGRIEQDLMYDTDGTLLRTITLDSELRTEVRTLRECSSSDPWVCDPVQPFDIFGDPTDLIDVRLKTITVSRDGRKTIYLEEDYPDGAHTQIVTYADGRVWKLETSPYVDEEVYNNCLRCKVSGTTQPNRTKTLSIYGPHPVYGDGVPVLTYQSITTPDGQTLEIDQEMTATTSDEDGDDENEVATLDINTTINGQTFAREYDRSSRTMTSTMPSGRQIVMSLDDEWRLSGITPNAQASEVSRFYAGSFEYDSRSRMQSVSLGESTSERTVMFSYADESGNDTPVVNLITGADGRETRMRYDTMLNLTEMFDPDDETNTLISLVYDEAGRLISLTPPNEEVYSFSYNGFGTWASYAAPETSGVSNPRTTYEVGIDGKLEAIYLPDGRKIDQSYDSAGRLNTVTTSRGAFNILYNADTGSVESWSTPEGIISAYEMDGPLLLSETWEGLFSDATQTVVSYTYDTTWWALKTLKAGTSIPISYTYDSDGVMSAAGDLSITRDKSFPRELSTTITSNATVTTNISLDEYGFLEMMDATFYNTSSIESGSFDFSYSTDEADRITNIVETTVDASSGTALLTTKDVSYEYISQNRLTTVTEDSVAVESYTYDSNGNRLTFSRINELGSIESGNATYDAQDRMLTHGEESFSYNDAGTLTSRTNSDGTTVYNYDELGNLIQVDLPNGSTIEYVMDALGRRIGRKIDGTLEVAWLYASLLEPIVEIGADGNIKSIFVYGTHSHVPDLVINGSTKYRVITDHLGSVRKLINLDTGEEAQSFTYDAWGNILESSGDLTLQPFRYAGGLYDEDTKLTRFGARDYDATTGRWTSKDPILFAGGQVNLYVYVNNDPVNKIDPSGLAVYWCHQVADLPFNDFFGLEHWWLMTDSYEFGLGVCGEGVPGVGGNSDMPFSPVCLNDHFGRSETPGAECELVDDADEECVNQTYENGGSYGNWIPGINDCQNVVDRIMYFCSGGSSGGYF